MVIYSNSAPKHLSKVISVIAEKEEPFEEVLIQEVAEIEELIEEEEVEQIDTEKKAKKKNNKQGE